ncbi:HAD family hydrolase [Pseudomonas citronellolis]|uniref:HAD family hydrolase n=1 Tax=Pseudomonas citronellolis TaxID=53408 RepID=UPI00248E2388|nr:HAD family hydrolase [Pseudomonas citronellolis]
MKTSSGCRKPATKAVIFDAFGTLLRIGARKQPYLQLMRLAREAGRPPHADDARTLMTQELGLAAAAERFQTPLPMSSLAELERDLLEELSSVTLYPDALPAINMLREAGIRVAVCSNLAAPYAVPVKLLLPTLDAYCWSFNVGAIKPEPAIYQHVAHQLACSPSSLSMIGDTLDADCLGPRRCGIRGYHLCRQGEAAEDAFSDLITFARLVVSTTE